MALASYWLLSMFEEKDNCGVIAAADMYEKYADYCTSQHVHPLCPSIFGKYLQTMFSKVQVLRRDLEVKLQNYYFGLKQKERRIEPMTLENIWELFVRDNDFMLAEKNGQAINILYQCDQLFLEVYWSNTLIKLSIGERDINLTNLGFATELPFNENNCQSVKLFITMIAKHKICKGRLMDYELYAIMSNFVIDNVDGEERLRSVKCHRVLPIPGTGVCCFACQNAARIAIRKRKNSIQMAAQASAPSLSGRQKHHTIGSIKRKPMKAALCNPYNIVWPTVNKEDASFVLELLDREFGAVELRKTSQIMRKEHHTEYKAFKKLKPDEKKKQIEKMRRERNPEEVNLMSQLVLGFQKVNKSLERDDLRLVLATRDSWLLIQHLAMLLGIRRCPAMAINGLESSVAEKLGVSKLSVFGFRKIQPGDSSRFDNLVESIIAKCRPFVIPWAELETELQSVKDEQLSVPEIHETPDMTGTENTESRGSSIEQNTSLGHKAIVTAESSEQNPTISNKMVATSTSIKNDIPEESVSDYSHLYLYKAKTQKKQIIIFDQKKDGDFVSVKHDGIDDLDFVTIEEGGTDRKTTKRKKKNKGSAKKMKLSPSSSSWNQMDVGRMVPNTNRKTKSKKLK